MASEVVTQAINETIKPNDKRAITAESLAALLHLMNEEGGAGGSGALTLKTGTVVDTGSDMPTTILTSEERAHNQEVYRIVKETVKNGGICPLITADIKSLLFASEPEAELFFEDCQIMMGPFIYGYVNAPIMASELGYSELVFCYSLFAVLLVLEDGSVIFSGSI